MKIRVTRANAPDAMLSHQHRGLRIMPQVAGESGNRGCDGFENCSVTLGGYEQLQAGRSVQRGKKRPRRVWCPRTAQHARMRDYALEFIGFLRSDTTHPDHVSTLQRAPDIARAPERLCRPRTRARSCRPQTLAALNVQCRLHMANHIIDIAARRALPPSRWRQHRQGLRCLSNVSVPFVSDCNASSFTQ